MLTRLRAWWYGYRDPLADVSCSWCFGVKLTHTVAVKGGFLVRLCLDCQERNRG